MDASILVSQVRPFPFHSTDRFLVSASGGSGDLGLTIGTQLLNRSRVKYTIIHRSRLLDSCCQCYLPSCLRCLFERWSNLVLGGISDKHIGARKHQISFPTASRRRHKYCIQPFTKFTTTSWCRALSSHLDLQPLWERLKPTEHCSCRFCLLWYEE